MWQSSRNKTGINFDKYEEIPVGLSLYTHTQHARVRTHTHTSLKIHNSKLKLAHIQKRDVYVYIEMHISYMETHAHA